MSRPRRLRPGPRPRAFATLLVLWVITVAVILLAALQLSSFRQAAQGREAVARVRAYWAARAGVEAQIAKLTVNTLTPDTNSAFTLTDQLAAAARGSVLNASWTIRHTDADGQELDGPEDAASKLNVNTLIRDDLLTLPYMNEGTADSIVDWADSDEDVSEAGAEAGSYETLRFPYAPRNGSFRSLEELDLVLGVRPEFVRGEDWNLNGRLDPSEDDGDLSWPPDNADGRLDAEWSAILTAASQDGGLGAETGTPRLDLRSASVDDIAKRLTVDATQAQTIQQYATSDGASLTDFIGTPLRDLATPTTGTVTPGTQLAGQAQIADLTDDQLRLLLAETTLGEESLLGPNTGRVNINTVARQTLEYLPSIDAATADALIQERQSRAAGFTSLVDLLEVPSIDRERLADLAIFLDVRSNVYIANVRGRDEATGTEVEIRAVLDRSTVPVVIREFRVR